MRVLPFLAAVVLAAACAPRDAEVRRARLAAERRSLEATLDHLEDRLLVNQARVRFWREMQARHESASAIACASLSEHALEIAAREAPARSSLHRARVASAAAPREAVRPRRELAGR